MLGLCGGVGASEFADEVGGRAVVVHLWFGGTRQLADDLLRQNFTELDAPLVEGVDVPDSALGEDGVLVECDEFAEDLRGEAFSKDDVRRTIALKDAMRDERVRSALGLDLLRCFSEGERLGLR